MRKRLKQWRKYRPQLRREQRLALNLGLALVLLTVLWGMADYPLPTARLEFRRLERTHLIEKSEIVFAAPELYQAPRTRSGHRTVTALDGRQVTLSSQLFVGVTEERAVVASFTRPLKYHPANQMIVTFPLREGPALLPLTCEGLPSDPYGYWITEGPVEGGYAYHYHNFAPLILLNAPEETVRVELTVDTEKGACSGVSWEMEGNVWLLGLEDAVLGENSGYVLRLFDGNGGLILERAGYLPEPE